MTRTLLGSVAMMATGYALFMAPLPHVTPPSHIEDLLRWFVFAQTGFALAVTLGVIELMAKADTSRWRIMLGLRLVSMFVVGVTSFVMFTIYERIGLQYITWAAPYGCLVFLVGDVGLWLVLRQLRRYCKQNLTLTLTFCGTP